jgi:putative drug exporter of the RND superfamily
VLRDFNVGQADPVVVVVEADPASGAVRDFMNELNALPGVARMQPRPDVVVPAAVIDVTPEGETAGPTSRDVVRGIRAIDAPFAVLVGGATAELVDYRDSVANRLPYAILVILLSTAVLLFVLTGSLVVPVKALVMNALTLLATPLLLFVFVFGLSMDYEVFLLSRIKEEWDRRDRKRRRTDRHTAANDRAVLAGIAKSGPVVTAAALCIAVVFLGFLLGDLIAVKEIGFAMAVALLLDVTVVRGLLLPALMSLLGEWNWWAPEPPHRLHERSFPVQYAMPEAAAPMLPSARQPDDQRALQ